MALAWMSGAVGRLSLRADGASMEGELHIVVSHQPRGHRQENFIPRLPRKACKAGNVYVPQEQGRKPLSPGFILGI